MEYKIIKIMISLAHISEKLKSLGDELDMLYELLGDKDFLKLLGAQDNEQVTIEDYD